jgi:conjugal transfer pilus assembly protein TraB
VATYLPVSFTRAVLLGGLDAPTGGQAQTNPQPVLLRLADHAFLPNRFRGAVKECLVIGAGYGDISAERAYIRTENLSCVRHDGRTLEVKIHGSIFGEDGKVGVRGRLVSKQGQLLANALTAGVVSGIGQAFQSRATTTALSPLGAVSAVTDGKEFEAGLSIGVGRAMDRLAQYYIALAEKTFPVIEVDAGRTVDVVLTQGVAIDAPAEPTDDVAAADDDPSDPTYPVSGDARSTQYRTVGGDDDE